MGDFDIIASINYIIRHTGVEKLTYVGHSQGTSQMFSAMSKNIEYFQSKLNGFIALGPVANLKNVSTMLAKYAALLRLDYLVEYVGIHDMFFGLKNMTHFCSIYVNMLDPYVVLSST